MKYLCENMDPYLGKQVRVYKNLHKDKYSIQAKNDKGNWVVIHHADRVTLRDATFKVYESGRQKVLRERRKNVHAYIYGEFTYTQLRGGYSLFTHFPLSYNPYEFDHFYVVDLDGKKQKLTNSHLVFLTKNEKIACCPG